MTHYAIIEQYGIQKNGGQSEIYDKEVTGHVCVYKRTYRLGGEFDECIEEACAALSGVVKDLPKLLVISAHGHERSGDLEIPGQKDDGDEKSICLWQHANAFQPIPDQTVVHLSSCFGAYPNALAIQYAPHSAPPIIAPLVNINFDDATALHTALLNYMNERGIGDAGLREFVDQQQEVLSIHDTYCGRYVVGLIDRIGTQHPPGAVGQLAAEVERSRIIFLVESVDYSILSVELDSSSGRAKGFKYSPPDDVAKGFWLAVQSGGQHKRLRVPLGELGDFIESDEYEAMCGRKFCALYQVAGIYGNDVRAELLEVKEIGNRTNTTRRPSENCAMQMMQIDESKFTRRRVMVTARLPKFAGADPTTPWVMLEAEDGSGLTAALMGPDSPESRADAARMMKLWNDALDAN